MALLTEARLYVISGVLAKRHLQATKAFSGR